MQQQNNNNTQGIIEDEPNKPNWSNTENPVCKVDKEGFSENNPKEPNFQQVHYVFTLNNYTEEEIQKLIIWFDKLCVRYCFQEEIGEQGTPHLQGYFNYKEKQYYKPLMKYMDMRIWIRQSLDTTKNKRKAIEYASAFWKRKEGGRLWNHKCPIKKEITLITPSYSWEVEILANLSLDPSDRKIYWYWSEMGNIGKTCFTKYLCKKKNACLLGGKRDNIFNGIVKYEEYYDELPSIVIYDIPRSVDEQYVSYEALEKVKDMCFYSGKYEGSQVVGDCPHVLVFANIPPDTCKMSPDRWIITRIDKPNQFEGR